MDFGTRNLKYSVLGASGTGWKVGARLVLEDMAAKLDVLLRMPETTESRSSSGFHTSGGLPFWMSSSHQDSEGDYGVYSAKLSAVSP